MVRMITFKDTEILCPQHMMTEKTTKDQNGFYIFEFFLFDVFTEIYNTLSTPGESVATCTGPISKWHLQQ